MDFSLQKKHGDIMILISSNKPILLVSSGRGRKGFYIHKHQQIASRRAAELVDFVNNCSASSETIVMVHYLEAIKALGTMKFAFKDVQFFLLNPQYNKVICVVAVSYCVNSLRVGVSDVCSLSCCSRFWRRVCGSDCIWTSLYRERWLDTDFMEDADSDHFSPTGWKGFYSRKHHQIARRAASVVDFVGQYSASETIDVVHYLNAVEDLRSVPLGFKDVQLFLLKPQHNALIHLIAVHYCVNWLNVQSEESILKSIPEDIALIIVSYLEVLDVRLLSCCSGFWRRVCGSDCIWSSLCRKRWPHTDLIEEADSAKLKLTGWKGFYTRKHQRMARRAADVVGLVGRHSKSSETMNAFRYFEAIDVLCSNQLGFKDVQLFLLKPRHDKLLYLLAVHYCVNSLKIPAYYVNEALEKCNVSGEQQICVSQWRPNRNFNYENRYGSCKFSLRDLALKKEEALVILGPLDRSDMISVVTPPPPTAQNAQW